MQNVETKKVFTPINLGQLELSNRIIVSPMCQYSAQEGVANDWHLVHLGQFAISGPALVFVEATAVEPRGRITPGCTGLYSDACEEAFKPIIKFFKNHSKSKLGIQLAHSGRKGSTQVPWNKNEPLQNTWETLAPSAISFGEPPYTTPRSMTISDIKTVKQAFIDAALRAVKLGFDIIQLHMAHGYLCHEFFSPLSNFRTDEYGGSLDNRLRFGLEIFEAVKNAVPKDFPIGVRISSTDFVENGWDIDEACVLCERLEKLGAVFIDASAGGLSADQKIPLEPGYQVKYAEQIKKHVKIPVSAVGLILEFEQIEAILENDQADLVSIARMMLYNPRFVWDAADYFHEKANYPEQYQYVLGESWKRWSKRPT